MPRSLAVHARRTLFSQRCFQLVAQRFSAFCFAANIIANVQRNGRARLQPKQIIKRRHRMNFRGSNIQPHRGVVQSARAQPPFAILQRVQDRQQQMSPVRRGRAQVLAIIVPVALLFRPEYCVNRSHFLIRRPVASQMQFHSVLPNLFNRNRRRLELRSSRFRVRRFNRQIVCAHLLWKMQRHERQPRP